MNDQIKNEEGKECDPKNPCNDCLAKTGNGHTPVGHAFAPACPTPKSGEMEEAERIVLEGFNAMEDGAWADALAIDGQSCYPLIEAVHKALSRQEKELTARFEGRMARVREAIEKSKYRMAETDDLIYHNGGLDAALAAFDKAAALKD